MPSEVVQMDLTGEVADPDDNRRRCPRGCGALVYPRGLTQHLAEDCDEVDRDPFGDTGAREVPTA